MLLAAAATVVTGPAAHASLAFEVESLDGTGNNRANPTWGQAGTDYVRVARARASEAKVSAGTRRAC